MTSVLHILSSAKTTVQKRNFSTTPRFAMKPSKLPEGLRTSGRISEESAFAPLELEASLRKKERRKKNGFQTALKFQTAKNEKELRESELH